ncbi:hypothetical protein DSCO28_10830 [Desulfosarcina ovata subsp. sediminis]|uniref:Uncharacterized protein n=1 Tax=Desulfosarcina ovata subsp. sediminis TaxID=885957 RepID=A0A5K7ZKK6_9BACT|nr:hypothetical protein [Desulfosarcina ovata]BBO80517.1 hypothetical protein DSCO28_10830 [Desulfosarcina ovata subsp. sediminis]
MVKRYLIVKLLAAHEGTVGEQLKNGWIHIGFALPDEKRRCVKGASIINDEGSSGQLLAPIKI